MTTVANVEQLERDIEDKQGEIATAQSNIETFEYTCDDAQFDDFLDDVEQSVTICGMEFYPSGILKIVILLHIDVKSQIMNQILTYQIAKSTKTYKLNLMNWKVN